MKEKIIEFLKSKRFETFLWQTANGLIGLMLVYIADESFLYAPIVISLLNAVTKYINVTYLKD